MRQENTSLKSQIEQLKGLVQDREQLQKELRTAADYIIGLEEKPFNASKTSKGVAGNVKEPQRGLNKTRLKSQTASHATLVH